MQAGDDASFETIFKRHSRPLLSYCQHMLGDRGEAEDALQQAFIRAHEALTGDAPPRALRPWLYAIARNCCLSAIAARRQTMELEDDRAPSLVGLADEVCAREDLRELVADIARLPEQQRSALLLAELDDLSHSAIASVIGCPVSKVKALVYQARTSLIAERDARNASCREIREQLSVARGGELRRGPLRRHLSMCTGCRDFQHLIAAQRESLATVLPVLPSAALAARVLGHVAAHGAGTAGVGSASAAIAPAGGVAATGTSLAASAGTGLTLVETTGATAVASALASTGTSAVIGGGLLAKVALAGTVAALASVGAVAIPPRPHGAEHEFRVGAQRLVQPPIGLAAATATAGAPGAAATPVALAASAGESAPAPAEVTSSGGLLTAAVLIAPPATLPQPAQVGSRQTHRAGAASSRQREPPSKLSPGEHARNRRRAGVARHRRHGPHHRRRHKRRKSLGRRHHRVLAAARQRRYPIARPSIGPRPPMLSPGPTRPRQARSAPATHRKGGAVVSAPGAPTATQIATVKRAGRTGPGPTGGGTHPAASSGPASRSDCQLSSGYATCPLGATGGFLESLSGGPDSAAGGQSSAPPSGERSAHSGPSSEPVATGAVGAESGGSSRPGNGPPLRTDTPRRGAAPTPIPGAHTETAAGRRAQ